MRVLLTTRGSAGHVLPLAPVAHACIEAGHEVLVAAQGQHRANVERARLPFAPVSDPPREELRRRREPLAGRVGGQPRAHAGRTGVRRAVHRRGGRCGAIVRRVRTTPPRTIAPLPDWWPGNDDPLVYVTFGSVTADPHLPYFPALYRAALDALASLPARVLVTIGNGSDPGRLGPVPRNCHVERWIPQDAVVAHAAAIVCHGGYGSTLGALAHGVPLVVVPLFSIDQWANADAVARMGAGVALTGERRTRRVLDLPGPATLAELAPAVSRVLADSAYRSAAALVADAVRALPPVDATVDLLAAVGRGDALAIRERGMTA
jgi:UDP:flavonoid glycosyltransferase YjiC (YdhE family)